MSHHTKYSLRSCFSIAISAATAGRLNLLLEVPADWNYYSMWQFLQAAQANQLIMYDTTLVDVPKPLATHNTWN